MYFPGTTAVPENNGGGAGISDFMRSDRYKQDIVALRIFTTNVYCSRESNLCGCRLKHKSTGKISHRRLGGGKVLYGASH